MTFEEQKAEWAKEDAAKLARGAAKEAYYAFLEKVEAKNVARPGKGRAYLTDEGVDNENSEQHEFGSLMYWQTMLASARDAAHERSIEEGVDLSGI